MLLRLVPGHICRLQSVNPLGSWKSILESVLEHVHTASSSSDSAIYRPLHGNTAFHRLSPCQSSSPKKEVEPRLEVV